MTELCVTELLL